MKFQKFPGNQKIPGKYNLWSNITLHRIDIFYRVKHGIRIKKVVLDVTAHMHIFEEETLKRPPEICVTVAGKKFCPESAADWEN